MGFSARTTRCLRLVAISSLGQYIPPWIEIRLDDWSLYNMALGDDLELGERIYSE
jgi:hypothetical protein